MRFAEQVRKEVIRSGNPVCVGIDPSTDRMAEVLLQHGHNGKGKRDIGALLTLFGRLVIDAVSSLVPVVKPQSAYFERYGSEGIRALEAIVKYAKDKGLLVVLDVKRGDIGETSLAYAEAYLGEDGPFGGLIDCITLNPYLGPDSLAPFVEVARRTGKGIFVCVKTSNPGAVYLQNQIANGEPIYAHVARLVARFAEEQNLPQGYSDMGAVVGATCGSEAREIRNLLPRSLFLVPGLGAQGGSLEVVRDCFDADGMGAIVNSSRGITYPPGHYTSLDQLGEAVQQAAKKFITDVQSCRPQPA
jgi:orotidine-5'-phosphate decarboxylase